MGKIGDSLIRMMKNANHLDSSVLTDVFPFNLRYTNANRICFVILDSEDTV